MIPRLLQNRLIAALTTMPVVALLGPRQVGKTTLALETAKSLAKESAYLDLELDTDRANRASGRRAELGGVCDREHYYAPVRQVAVQLLPDQRPG
jgi:predicted AAA+ superfamily ATPase